MRAVTGSVASSKRVSVSKAAAILSRFAAAETGARRDVVAYLKRASAAFDELVCFHREVRDGRRRPERGRREEEKEARRKKRAGSDGKPNPREVEGNPIGRPEEIRWIREVEEEKEVMVDGGDGNLTEVEGDYGGGIGRGEDGKRNSKKKGVNDEKESNELVGRNERNMEVEGERRKEEKKRRETGEEGRDGAGKKRRNSDDGEENEGGGLDDQSERHKKRKKRRKIGREE